MKNRNLTRLFIFLIGITTVMLLTKCNEEDEQMFRIITDCNQGEDISWFEKEVENQGELYNKYFYVSQAIYEGEIVFLFENCCPFCNTITPVKNCSGVTLGLLGISDEDIKYEELSNIKIVWKAPENECVFTN